MSSNQTNAPSAATCRLADAPVVGISDGSLEELRKMSLWNSISKQERDYVTATLILRGRHLTERALRNGIRNWTPFGASALGETLVQRQLLAPEVLARIQEEAEEYFETLNLSASWKCMPQSVSRRTSSLLERLDPSGHVAKIFGLSRLPRAVVGNEFRLSKTQFRLVRKIGQGGLGTVWLAIDSNLNRYVAVKEILGHPDRHSAAVARFRREAEITGRLDHPGIVPVHALAEDESGERLFYVMRFLGNETLEDAIREYHERREAGQTQPMDFHRLLTAFVSICQAIAYAHAHQVVHRDLKPQNVALDSFGQVIVLDWGLAKSLGMDDPQTFASTSLQKQPDNLDVTVAGQVTGTPMYMAPEQATGRVDEIDERTDVYGLGAILFCILTGYAPHELSQESLASGSGMAQLLDLIVEGPAASPRKLNSSVPPALEAICLKAMAVDRHSRYPSAAALADDVQRWMADEPISILQEPVRKRLRRWIAKHYRLSQLLAVVLTAILVTGAVAGFSSYQYAVIGNQMRREKAADEIRELRSGLAYEIQTLTEHVRFLARLPAVQGILDENGNSTAREEGIERLKRSFRQLIDTRPSHLAISSWVKLESGERINARVERGDVAEDDLRVDFTEFFGRHLPAITQLGERDAYLGMPGRLSKDLAGHSDAARRAFAESTEAVAKNLVAGAAVFDPSTKERLGGVLIECDLERILREHLFTASPNAAEIDLTDSRGQSIMRFTREKGLFPIEPMTVDPAERAMTGPFFTSKGSSDVFVASPTLTATKVTLNRHEAGHYMGLIVRSRPGVSADAY